MTTPTFTKEQLESIVAWDGAMQPCPNLAAFALSLMEEKDRVTLMLIDCQDKVYKLGDSLLNAEAERDDARRELAEARARGMLEAAEIARNLRPKSACTCGNYLSFHNGVPGHQPGCLVGECIDIADEIEGRADEIDRSNRE